MFQCTRSVLICDQINVLHCDIISELTTSISSTFGMNEGDDTTDCMVSSIVRRELITVNENGDIEISQNRTALSSFLAAEEICRQAG